MRRFSILILATAATLATACTGTTAEAPLRMSLGGTRASVTTQLRSHQYCHEDAGPPQRSESYPRCERVGPEWGESWVVAIFDHDTLVELRRWERFTDDNKAIERWNKLVGDRNKITPESAEALQTLRGSGLLQAGTRTVKAFRDGDSIIGVYLLTPTAPEEASVLEKVIRLPRK